jgi:2-hydroxy-3-oxopropionate reductase
MVPARLGCPPSRDVRDRRVSRAIMDAVTTDVAVIGLGAMGLPIARNLARSGLGVQVAGRSPGALAEAAAAGAAPTPLAELASPVVLTVLPDVPELRSVLDAGLREALARRAGTTLVVMSTSAPDAVRALGEELAADGTVVVDAPMSGGDIGATRGELTLFVGGDPAALEELRPVFAPIATTVTRFGPLGSGSLAKLANQIVVGGTIAALAEAAVLAERGGLDVDLLFDALEGGLADSAVLRTKARRMVSRDYSIGARSRYQLKDLDFAGPGGARRTPADGPAAGPVRGLRRGRRRGPRPHGDRGAHSRLTSP